ncbi:hypothetical protein [Sporosarcina sp. HYO08]|uniref:hypothetical protein n=1 Tax=Sporosarcina sp. HYO08 TaxID=1759557 RepID=UPI0007977A75|nr:hypothetical protein [Sporosarcina sp. HYO08]KXH84049.1 hypothetical protein AU377_04660 [Sporosarcina sp. HYO08]
MRELIDSTQRFFDFDFDAIKSYFTSLALTLIVTYLIIVIFRKIVQELFKRTRILEEKKKETIESVVKNTSRYIYAIIILIAIIGFGAQKLFDNEMKMAELKIYHK